MINTNHFWDRSFSHFPSQIPIFSNQNIKFFQNNFVIFSDAVLLVEAGGRLPTGTRCRISCLQLSTTSCRHEKSARRRTRSGGPRPARTGAERRHRTFEPRIGLENKKERCFMHHSFLFISARRGSKPFPPLQGFSNGLPVETLQRGEVDLSASLAIIFLSCQKLGSRRRRQYYPQLLRHETLYHEPLILSMFLHVSLVLQLLRHET